MKRDIPALNRYLAAREAMPFGWWGNDCVTYARGAVLAQGGDDPLLGVLPWSSEAEAHARLATFGGIVAALNTRLRPLDATAMAMRGDIGLVPLADGKFFLAVVEAQTIAGPGILRARHERRALMTHAWSAL